MTKNAAPEAPYVVGCGYRQISSPKTGLCFPAWCVQLPQQQSVRWRSKRDFLLLGLATKDLHPPLRLPKKALAKLSQHDSWRRTDCQVTESALSKPNNAYHVSMKKNLLQLDQYLKAACQRSGESNDLQQAWDCFCRPEDTDHLMDVHDNHIPAPATTPARLGQYFCTKENAQEMLDMVLKYTKTWSDSFILEPSCGHGDILWELLQTLDDDTANLTICAYDIDPNAICHCQQRQPPQETNITWNCADFLTTQRRAVVNNRKVVVLGGPPYTSAEDPTQRDLPQQFLTHCLLEWKADWVAFLVPQRYRDHPLVVPPGYQLLETRNLKSSTFYFHGQTPVTQPSILQCWGRTAPSEL